MSDRTETIRRELRIDEGVEVVHAAPRLTLGMAFAMATLLVVGGLAAVSGLRLIPTIIIALLLAAIYRNYFKLKDLGRPKNISERRIRSFLIFSLLMGTAWGALLFLNIRAGDADMQSVAMMLAFILAFGSMSVSSPRVILGFGLPLLLFTGAGAILYGGLAPLGTIALFSLSCITVVYYALQAARANTALTELAVDRTSALEERHAADERLRESELRAARAEQERHAEVVRMQRSMINAVPFPMVLADEERVIEVTPQARARFGIGDSDLSGFRLAEFIADPADARRLMKEIRTDGRVDDFETLMKDTAGNAFWVTMAVRTFDYDGAPCWLTAIYVIDARKRMEQDLAASKESAETALVELEKAQASLVHAEKMASLGQLTAGIAHEIKNPLNFVNNFSKLSVGLLDELVEILSDPIASLPEDDREDADDITDTLRANLTRIEEHGARADAIVRNMLLHSRGGAGDRQQVELNPLAREALNLAYHGARATDRGVDIELETDLSDDVGTITAAPQEIQRVILNLCSNAIYAAGKRSADDGERPRLTLATRTEGDQYVVTVTDNGDGVPDDMRETIFQPFVTTKPTGEGTGLGLSLSYDTVKHHGGSLALLPRKSDGGASFELRLPRAVRGE